MKSRIEGRGFRIADHGLQNSFDPRSSIFDLQSSILENALFLLEHAARLEGRGWVNRRISFFDVTNDAFLVNHKRGARTEALGFVEYTVVFDNLALLEIAEQRERQPLGFRS